jgi:hypothetical protein
VNKRAQAVTIAGLIVLILILVEIMVTSGHRSGPAAIVPVEFNAAQAKPIAAGLDAAASTASIQLPPLDELWMRPSAKVAARNVRRCSLGSTLRSLGASDANVERLTEGDIQAVVSELKQRAKADDGSASNQLLYMSRMTCGFAAINGAGSASEASQLLDAQALPTADGDWVRAAIQEKDEFNQHMTAVCQQDLNKDDANAWETAAAAQGDAVSHYLLAVFGSNHGRQYRDVQLLAAVNGGYSWAQYYLGQRMINGIPLSSDAGTLSENAGDLVRAAALELPEAESHLAKCEFSGCTDIPVDIAAAVVDARNAAQRGSLDAILEIEPQLQASQIDPDEVEAWNLISASLQMQGYAGGALDARLLKSASSTLSSPIASAKARKLADQYWQEYGAQMLANLGCRA